MSKRIRLDGFSLVEMIVVMAVIAILAVLSIPVLSSVSRANSLTQASSTVVGILTFAKQSAIAQNQTMEVRIYQYADPNFPGETVGNAASGKYRGMQVFAISDSGVATPMDKMEALPAGIIIDSNAVLSALLAAGQAKTTWTTIDPQVPLPSIGTQYNCKAFRFRPDGSTNLAVSPPSPPGSWCFTLYSLVLGDGLAAPPANFATIEIDAVSGKVTTFRP